MTVKILLMGNPNVGKSVIFSRLTGTSVTSSNYPGTTVEFTEGLLRWKGEIVRIIDVPGTYTLNPTNKAEEVAVEMLAVGDLVVNVVDATNLGRNLNLTIQLLEQGIPVIVALNFWDEARHKGIKIDLARLEEMLGIPVIPTVAVTGQGIRDLIDRFNYRACIIRNCLNNAERWNEVARIVKEVQVINLRAHSFRELAEDLAIRPLTGIPLAFFVLTLVFLLIRFTGEGILKYLTDPFFEYLYRPLISQASVLLGGEGFIHDLFIGQLIGGKIDFEQSFGLLTTGIYIPLAAVIPYIIAFYFVLGLLEDTGYLPRLAVLVDNIMHRVGLHGFSIIPMILGFGCNVPAALAIRTLESKREKFIASTLLAISIPCMSQTAMIIGLLGRYGVKYIGFVFMILFSVWFIVGLLLNKILPGFSNDLLLEVPPFRVPSFRTIFQKLWMRILSFIKEAVPFVLFGIILVNFLYFTGMIQKMTQLTGPVLKQIFGLPREAISPLLLGFLRKDLAMGLLVPLNLSVKELVVASTILTIYFPCIATFSVLIRELGIFNMLKATFIMLLTTVVVGGFVNFAFGVNGFSTLGWLVFFLILLLARKGMQ